MGFRRFLEKSRREIEFTQSGLKIIAILSMLIDHIALVFIKNGKLYGYDSVLYENAIKLKEASSWLALYKICRVIGRISFPIFAFLIVEGFRHTNNYFKYILRILLFALISEIPFNLMVANRVFYPYSQNVLCTYFVGLLMLLAIKIVPEIIPIRISLLGCAGLICYMLKTDYAIEGILLIFIFYVFRHDLDLKSILALIVMVVFSFEKYYGLAGLAIPFIYCYGGRKGYFDLKRIPYIIYPLHMIILYGILYLTYFK